MNYYHPHRCTTTVDPMFNQVCQDLLCAPSVNTGHWQAKRDVPMTQTRELMNCILELPIASTAGAWASWIRPNLPWAEDHFQERVSGKPLNPPPSHVNWPFNQQGNKDHMDGQVFSHSYPERLWPRFAPSSPEELDDSEPVWGIRYRLGDLDDLVALLVREPHTRQAYAPLWFPEDLAASVQGQRVPCTLGYHFILRRNRLHCFYPMRSLDWLRYAKDDAYMAGRLCQWVIERCRLQSGENGVWHDVMPGTLTMHVVSLHIFEADVPGVRFQLEKQRKKAAA